MREYRDERVIHLERVNAALLEALEYAMTWLDVADRFKYPVGYGEGQSPQQARDKARAAIALAKGEQ